MLENRMVIGAEREWNEIGNQEICFDNLSRWDIAEYIDASELDLKAICEGLGFDGEGYMDVDEVCTIKGLLEQHNRERLHTYYIDYIVHHNLEHEIENWYRELYGMEE